MLDLLPEHDATRLAIRNAWTDEQRQERDTISVNEMIRCFESAYWVGEREDAKLRKRNERKKLERRRSSNSHANK